MIKCTLPICRAFVIAPLSGNGDPEKSVGRRRRYEHVQVRVSRMRRWCPKCGSQIAMSVCPSGVVKCNEACYQVAVFEIAKEKKKVFIRFFQSGQRLYKLCSFFPFTFQRL